MVPPASLTARWRRIKKRCSFSSSDRLVRSKSFTEPEAGRGPGEEGDGERYLTVGAGDAGRFHSLRARIGQWNSELKKRRSSESLAGERAGREGRGGADGGFVVAAASSQGAVRSALVVSAAAPAAYSTRSLRPRPKPSLGSSPWSSPSPSPPASHHSSEPERRAFTSPRGPQYQDQDSGYDGFCPEKSLYSTCSSDTSSELSSDGPDASYSREYPEASGRLAARPRPAAIYEPHASYCPELQGREGGPLHQSTPLAKGGQYRAGVRVVAQATVVSLARTGELPPPLPPRPAPPLPPVSRAKPRARTVQQGTVSLPRRRPGAREVPREGPASVQSPGQGSGFCTLPRQRKGPGCSIRTATFEKGPGRKSLGFTVVGGKDSPKGSIGIYVKSVFPSGQAVGLLLEGGRFRG
jgi:hypothetical protein